MTVNKETDKFWDFCYCPLNKGCPLNIGLMYLFLIADFRNEVRVPQKTWLADVIFWSA